MLSVRWGSATDVGLVRDHNEDALLASDRLFVVADGMGGHAAGEVASAITISSFEALTRRRPLHESDVIATVHSANAQIVATAYSRGERFGMGTTVTGLALVDSSAGPQWAVFNVGDSRVYRFADGLLSQVTVDHSEVEELVAAGRLTKEQARVHPRRNVITRSLGTDPAPMPDIWLAAPVPGERFVVCSDGLNSEVEDEAIARILRNHTDAQEACDALVREALDNGGSDNVTVIVVDVVEV